MTSGVAGAKLKLMRAREHVDMLDAAVKRFRQSHPYEFRPECKPNEPGTPDVFIRVVVTQAHDIPDTWPLVVGDALTNLRAALDHAVYPHIRRQRPNMADRDIQYPIHNTRAQFENKTRFFTRPVYQVVNDSQPYRATEPQWHPLAVLRDLVNCDKHRTLIVSNYATMQINLSVDTELFDVVEKLAFTDKVMDVGAVVGGAHLRLKRAVTGWEVAQFRSEVGYTEAIEIPNTNGQAHGMLSTMQNLCDTVESLLTDLEDAGV
ncbi:hypothetical protein [Nocardia nepalensis]|uniref:hypothetical protein n=1 Tax=Nocardia nepalensis TaxID=3375448 RepID=UPI003B67E062